MFRFILYLNFYYSNCIIYVRELEIIYTKNIKLEIRNFVIIDFRFCNYFKIITK